MHTGICFWILALASLSNVAFAAGQASLGGGAIDKIASASYSRPIPIYSSQVDYGHRKVSIEALVDTFGLCYGQLELTKVKRDGKQVQVVARAAFKDSPYLCVNPWRPNGVRQVLTRLELDFADLGIEAGESVRVCNTENRNETVGALYVVGFDPEIKRYLNTECNIGGEENPKLEAKSDSLRVAVARALVALGLKKFDPYFDSGFMYENIGKIRSLSVSSPRAKDFDGFDGLVSLNIEGAENISMDDLVGMPNLQALRLYGHHGLPFPADLLKYFPDMRKVELSYLDDSQILGDWRDNSIHANYLHLEFTELSETFRQKRCEVFRSNPDLSVLNINGTKFNRGDCL